MKKILLLASTVVLINVSSQADSTSHPCWIKTSNLSLVEKDRTTEEEVHKGLPISIWTNQSTDQIFVRSTETLKSVSLEVVDSNSTVVMKFHLPILSELDLTVASLPEGKYFVRISNQKGLSLVPFFRRS